MYYFKEKNECMDVRRARGSIDLGRVATVQGTVQSSAAGLIEVTMQQGRVYELEVPMPEFDRTLKSFCAFAPAVFVANWPPVFNARILEHSVSLLRQQPGQLNTFLAALLSRTPVFEEEKALAALACMDQWLLLYAEDLPLDAEIAVQTAAAVVESELCSLWVIFLEMCYRNFGALVRNAEVRRRLVHEKLVVEWFEQAFLHWSISARWAYFQLLAAAAKDCSNASRLSVSLRSWFSRTARSDRSKERRSRSRSRSAQIFQLVINSDVQDVCLWHEILPKCAAARSWEVSPI